MANHLDQGWLSVPRRAWREGARPIEAWRAYRSAREVATGLTPKDEVWSLNRMRLYRYRPTRPERDRHPTPVLLVYAIINTPFIFDLLPGKSFVEFMLDQGFDMYLLDWGDPGPEDEDITFDDYGAEFLPRAVRRVLEDSGADGLSMLGYCVGSTIALLYAALYPDGPLRNMVLLTPPLDQSHQEGALFDLWLNERWFDPDRTVEAFGNLSAEGIASGSQMLKAVANYVGAYVQLLDRVGDDADVEKWQAMHQWVHDGVDVPGAAFRQYIVDYMRRNAFAAGEHFVKGRRVDLADVKVPIMVAMADQDHIVPAGQAKGVEKLVGSTDVTTKVLHAGHVGLMAGRPAHQILWPAVAEWLGERSGKRRRRKRG